jgi:hypothetical protein
MYMTDLSVGSNPLNKPLPDGAVLEIPEVWQDSLTGSDITSLVDPHVDQPTIILKASEIDTLAGAIGQDKVNFAVHAILKDISYAVNVGLAMAWDPERRAAAPLLYQANLKSAPEITAEYREEFLPKYPYLRAPGTHTLVIMAHLREITNTWDMKDGTYTKFTKFPRVGNLAIRKINVVILDE